jgi:thermitase
MKERILSVLLLTLILTSTLTAAFNMKASFAEGYESMLSDEHSFEDTGETASPSKECSESQQNMFERSNIKPEETKGQPSPEDLDSRSFNTSKWSELPDVGDNKTRLIVGVDNEKPECLLELKRTVTKHQGTIVNTVAIRSTPIAVVVELSMASVPVFLEDLRVAELASYVEPNMKVQALLVPNDPYWSMQWGAQKIQADWAWNVTVGNPSVLVAVADTGIAYTHPDIVANYVPLGYDWVNIDSDPWDDHGHGTHCAGIIAAVLNNGEGIAGLAQVRVMAEKVLDSSGGGYWDWIANGIIHATDMGAKVISMSLGGYGESELVHDAVRYAYNAGVLIIAAAGNDNTNMKLYPAGYDEVIAVAATDQYDGKAWFSNWGDWIELAAPGVDIVSTVPWGYESSSGTSMACPHVSGVAALVWSRYLGSSRDWVRLWLRNTADDLGDPGFDVYYGYGRINARKAVELPLPAHELVAYGWVTPPYVKPGSFGIINATVLNSGENDETDVVVQLFANGSEVDSELIGYLASGNFATVTLTWSPAIEGIYNITLHVVPVFEETNIENNVLEKYIYVGVPVKAVVLHSAGNFYGEIITNWQALNSEWNLFGDTMVYIDYVTLGKNDITYADIAATQADVLIISCASDPYAGWQFTDSEIEAIKSYVYEGHGLIATAGTFYYQVPNNNKLAPLFGLNETMICDTTGTDLLHLLNTTHPLFRNVPNPFIFADVQTAIPSDGRWDANELAGGKYLALGHYQEGAIVTYRGLVYISPWLETIQPYYTHHLQLLYNAIMWSRYQKPQHELSVNLEAPRHLRPGESTLLNATVSNIGLNNETNVELYLQIDGVTANSATIPELCIGASYQISILWTPTVERIYNITAYSPPLAGEEYSFNNVDSIMLYVRLARFVLWDNTKDNDGDSLLGNYYNIYQLLTANGFIVDELTTGPITSAIMAGYDILVLMDPEIDYSPSEIADIQEWVETGGALISIPDGGYPSTINTLMAPYGVQMTGGAGGWGTTSDIVSHPITEDVDSIYVDLVREISVTMPSTCLAWMTESGYPYGFLSATESGEVVVVSDSNIMDNDGLGMADNTQLMLNIFNYVGVKPEHELAVSIDAPKAVRPNQSALLNATVTNRGLNNETSVQLQLLIEGEVVESATIAMLVTGHSYTLSYLWTPTVEDTYNITAYAPPVLGEDNARNNVKSARVIVTAIVVAIFQNMDPWDYPANEEALDRYGIPYVIFSSGDFGSVDLSSFAKVVIVSDQDQAFYNDMDAYRWWFEDYARNGGVLEIHAADYGWHGGAWIGTLPGGLQWTGYYYNNYVTIVDPGHPVVTLPNLISDAELDNWGSSVHGYFNAFPAGTHFVIVEGNTGMPGYLEFAYGSGYITASSQTLEWAYEHRFSLILENSLLYEPVRFEHDLAIGLEAPITLELGNFAIVNATVQNTGMNNETNVGLYLLINNSIVNSVIIPELRVSESFTISYLWTPTGTGNYNITACAPPISGENHTINNVMTKWVITFFYTRFCFPHEWIGAGDPMGWYADDASWEYTLPFAFPFYGIRYQKIYISSNGLITFLGPDTSYGNSVPALAGKLAIAVAWDDWVTNDIYIWQNSTNIGIRWYVRHYGTSIIANFEAILRIDGLIQLNYEYNDGDISATVGISNGDGHIIAEDFTSLNYIDTIFFIPFLLEHELVVKLDAPALLEPSTTALLNATAVNFGLSNETDVELQLLINDTVVEAVVIPELLTGTSYTITYPWAPTQEGSYNITAYVTPIPGELIITNNDVTKIVRVRILPNLLVIDTPWAEDAGALDKLGYEYALVSPAEFATVDLYTFDLLFVGWVPGDEVVNALMARAPEIAAWVSAGNGIVGLSEFYEGNRWAWLPLWVISGEYYGDGVQIVEPAHPVMWNLTDAELSGWMNSYHGQFYDYDASWTVLARETAIGYPITLAATYGNGRIVITQQDPDYHFYYNNIPGAEKLLRNMLEWAGVQPGAYHDVAVTDIAVPTNVAYRGWIININVTVANLGNQSETFTVKLYYNTTLIATQTVNIPESNVTLKITFAWNTSGVPLYVNHTIWAEAVAIPGEINTDNNVYFDDIVLVKKIGDVNSDRKVDGKDLAFVCKAFDSCPSDPRWNPNTDFNQDNKIDGKDIALWAKNIV